MLFRRKTSDSRWIEQTAGTVDLLQSVPTQLNAAIGEDAHAKRLFHDFRSLLPELERRTALISPNPPKDVLGDSP